MVEGVVKYVRLNFFVPVPQVRDLEELNERLAQLCREDLNRRLRGKSGPKAELLVEDQAAFCSPPHNVLSMHVVQQSTIASSLSLVRFRRQRLFGACPVRSPSYSGKGIR